MKTNRQRPISVNTRQRKKLDRYKKRFEKSIKGKTDWGEFLGTAVLFGLAAAGIYQLVKASQRSPDSVDVQCPECGVTFVMAVPASVRRAVETTCLNCGAELVVDTGITS